MQNDDTIHLLKECDSGTKMAVTSIDDVLEHVTAPKLQELLSESKEKHERLGNELHHILSENGCEDKEPNPMAKGMSWIKTNWNLAMNESDQTVADLIIDGCNMGVKSLYKYLNQYKNASSSAVGICKRLITIEENLGDALRVYL